MTSAARPTWKAAIGSASIAPTAQVSSRDLPSHKELKYRVKSTESKNKDEDEQEETDAKRLRCSNDITDEDDHSEELSNQDDDEYSAEETTEGEEEEEDEEDYEALQRELEKIREERREKAASTANPLLSNRLGSAPRPDSFVVKKSWTDDTVFKNQTKVGPDAAIKKPARFINDTTKSDYHRKFIDKYVK